MTDEQLVWKYFEIDGERYEFRRPTQCPFYGSDYHECRNKKVKSGFCRDYDNSEPCPARVIPNVGVCPECGGSGRKHYNGEIALRCMECLHCNGTGKVLLVAKCPECGGSGLESCGGIPTFETTFNYCKRCKGRGVL